MKERKVIRPIIGVLCILAVLGLALLAIFLDSQSPDPILGIFQTDPTTEPEESTGPTEQTRPGGDATDEQVTPPNTDLPATVVIPSEKDPETGKPGPLTFPCQVPGYGLSIEKLAPYSGMFVEDGTNVSVENVAMLLVENNGNFPIEYTRILVEYGEESLSFDISALPVGERIVVQEKTGKPLPETQPGAATALVVQRADMEMSARQVQVTDNGDNTLTIRNLTEEMIPTVRVFYKYYMEDEGLFVGGIAFTVRVTRLAGKGSVTIQPSHYTSQTSRVVMVLTYDQEV